jgi:hypothetical protein
MRTKLTPSPATARATTLACCVALGVIATPASSQAQAGRGAIARRGAPGAPAVPMTDVSITIGGARYTGRVDAKCGLDERATTGNTRFYFVVMYPWFGQRVSADKPQWRFNLSVRRGAKPNAYDQFVFSFLDGRKKSGTIQVIAGSERMGSGTVKVTRHGAGVRFDVAGRSDKGDPIQATIDCSAFQGGEAAGG